MSTETTTPATLPPTSGRWAPITRGKAAPVVTAWHEVFRIAGGRGWCSIPGVSRFVNV